jgi:hypothetical protein
MKGVNREQTSLFLLIFSAAIYVRDAGVAGSNPATPTIIFKYLVFSPISTPRTIPRRMAVTRNQAAAFFAIFFAVIPCTASARWSGWWWP